MKKKEIDRIDALIINELGQDATLTNKALSQKIGLSEPATHVRLNKLWEKGVIKSTKANIDIEYFGFATQVFVFISVSNQNAGKLIKNAIELREVCHCAELQSLQFANGSRRFYVHINAKSNDHVSLILERLFDQVQQIHFELFSLDRTVKDSVLLISMHDFDETI